MTHQCNECRTEKRDWNECPGAPDWYPHSAIHSYCPNQVIWLMESLLIGEQGYWPSEHVETGYSGGKRVRYMKRGAYFEIPICIYAEITWRLDQCGRDGALAKLHYAHGIDVYEVAQLRGMSADFVQERIRRVINYISGRGRKEILYYEFSRRQGISESFRR